MKKKLSLLVALLIATMMFSQVRIGSAGAVDNSLVLEVDKNSKNGGVLIPQVELTSDLESKNPLTFDPAEGLMVYNINTVATNPKEGFYIWFNSRWNYIADNNNMVNDMVLLNNNLSQNFAIPTTGTYVNTNTINYSLFSNNISGASLNPTTRVVTLPKGNYTVHAVIEFTATGLSTTDQIPGGSGVNAMEFVGKIINPSTTTQYGVSKVANSILRNQVKKGQMLFNFKFSLAAQTDIVLAIAKSTGGSYEGNITVNNYSLHIQSGK